MTLYIGANMQHIFPIYCGVVPEADAAVAMIGAWISFRRSGDSDPDSLSLYRGLFADRDMLQPLVGRIRVIVSPKSFTKSSLTQRGFVHDNG
jgi:hypothetical protein